MLGWFVSCASIILKMKKAAWRIPVVQETPRIRMRLNNIVHLLSKATPSRLGKDIQ